MRSFVLYSCFIRTATRVFHYNHADHSRQTFEIFTGSRRTVVHCAGHSRRILTGAANHSFHVAGRGLFRPVFTAISQRLAQQQNVRSNHTTMASAAKYTEKSQATSNFFDCGGVYNFHRVLDSGHHHPDVDGGYGSDINRLFSTSAKWRSQYSKTAINGEYSTLNQHI